VTAPDAPDGGPLPVDAVLDEIRAVLRDHRTAILVAPPGAGKTTRVPPALLGEEFMAGRALKVIEPRRLAAKAAAERMAELRGEAPGETVGYRVRLESRVSARTRIEVVTDGVFRRQILDDPELTGCGAVLFDEFHERSLDGDFAFALVRDVQAALREDLRVLIMSATIDAADLSGRLGGAPVIESLGRLYPVETRYRPRAPDRHLEEDMAGAVLEAVRTEPGSVLCFLPGQREIARTAERLEGRLPAGTELHQLAGALDRALQDRAIRPPAAGRRKVVLATSIAETSLTIEGVRVVIDCGLARVARFDPGSQMSRLETVRAPLSSVDQRRGRAGRTGPGLCLRLWQEAQTGALPAKPEPEIRQADLTQVVLDMAGWGVTDPAALPWLDAPPQDAWIQAVALLKRIGALAADRTITAHGRALGGLPLHPRLGHMIVEAADNGFSAAAAAEIAALLSEPGLGGRELDLQSRLISFRSRKSPAASNLRRQAGAWARQVEKRRGNTAGSAPEAAPGLLLAFAYPDRIAQARGRDGGFRLSNGKGCVVDPAEPLSLAPYLVVADTAGKAAHARALLAAPIDPADIFRHFKGLIVRTETLAFDENRKAVTLTGADTLGALVLKRQVRPAAAGAATTALLLKEIAKRGFSCLPFETHVDEFCARIGFLRENGGTDLPEISSDDLLHRLDGWLQPFLAGAVALSDLSPEGFEHALDLSVGPQATAALARLAPLTCGLPAGGRRRIDYLRDGGPGIAVKPHEVFGPAPHPAILGGAYPLAVTLLSPAGRPLQVTRDLQGFWSGTWKEVRSELRARYPKHFWPEDPAREAPAHSSIKRK